MKRLMSELMLCVMFCAGAGTMHGQLANNARRIDYGRDTSRITITPTALLTEKVIVARLQDSLQLVRERVEQLYAVLDGVDRYSFNFSGLRSWRINDFDFQDVLRNAVFRVTQDSNMILEKSDVQVIATPPPHNDLVAIYFGENELQGKRLREVLNDESNKPLRLKQKLIASGQYGQDRELVDRGFKIENILPPMLITESDSILTNFNRYDLSIDPRTEPTVLNIRLFDNANIRFGNDWGAEMRLGNDELGYPMWTSGNLALMALYKRIKLGMQVPFAGGTEGSPLLGGSLRPRRLDGTYGVTGEFDFAFVGGSFSFGDKRRDTDGTFADPKNIYTIRSSAQLWYSYSLSVNNKANLLRVKFGAGMHSVSHDALTVNATGQSGILPVDRTRFFWSPYLKVEFMNQQFSNRFGASLQYYKEWGLATLWLEVVNNTLRLELKGAMPLLRSRAAWEPSHFVTLTIPYTVNL
jgi:hypothetical protein